MRMPAQLPTMSHPGAQVFWDKFMGRSHRWIPIIPFELPGHVNDVMPKRKDLDTKQSRSADTPPRPALDPA